jgi:hypothetical protein
VFFLCHAAGPSTFAHCCPRCPRSFQSYSGLYKHGLSQHQSLIGTSGKCTELTTSELAGRLSSLSRGQENARQRRSRQKKRALLETSVGQVVTSVGGLTYPRSQTEKSGPVMPGPLFVSATPAPAVAETGEMPSSSVGQVSPRSRTAKSRPEMPDMVAALETPVVSPLKPFMPDYDDMTSLWSFLEDIDSSPRSRDLPGPDSGVVSPVPDVRNEEPAVGTPVSACGSSLSRAVQSTVETASAMSGPDWHRSPLNVPAAATALASVMPLWPRTSEQQLATWLTSTFEVDGIDDHLAAEAMVTAAVTHGQSSATRLLHVASRLMSGQSALFMLVSELSVMAGRPRRSSSSRSSGELPSPSADSV